MALQVDDIPLLDGARETIARGILSSLHPHNVQIAAEVHDAESASRHPLWPILFDPQTGELLTSCQAHAAHAVLFCATIVSRMKTFDASQS